MNQERTCAECSQPITGRSDKQFCTNKCRTSAHNRKKKLSSTEQLISQLNSVLRKNRTILNNIALLGFTKVQQEALKLVGFDFRFFTHLFQTPGGDIYYFCYDFGYLLLPDGKVLIVNEQTFMNDQ